jgi:hypothetical protein
VTSDINTFLAHYTQDLFFTENRIVLFGYINQAIFTDVEGTDINFPHHLPA